MEAIKKENYTPRPGFYDLTKLNLPPGKFSVYARLQNLAALYADTAEYQKKENRTQYGDLKEIVSEMNLDLILNYNALERREDTCPATCG